MHQAIEHEPESSLVTAARNGDAEAFNVLVRRYFGMVYMIGYSRLRQPEPAEELAQEVFLRVFLHLAKLDHPEYFAAWITQIARNLAATWHTQGQTRSRLVPMVPIDGLEDEMPDKHAPSVRDVVAAREEEALLRSALFELPVDDRDVVLLHYSEGLSKSEIARRQGVHPSSVQRRLDRVVAGLRDRFGSTCETGLQKMKSPDSSAARACGIILAIVALPQAARIALAAQAELGALVSAPVAAALPAASSSGTLSTFLGTKLGITIVIGASVLVVGGTLHLRHRHVSARKTPAAETRQPSEVSRSSVLPGRDELDLTRTARRSIRPSGQTSAMQSSASATPSATHGTASASTWNKQSVEPAIPADTTGTLVRGKVLKPDGSPAVGATVNVLSYKYWKRPTAVATSDASGYFEHRLPTGSYWFYAKRGSMVSRDHVSVEVRPNGTTNREPEIQLEQGGSVHGMVTDTSSGKPVQDAMVITDAGDFVRTDSDGRFMIAGFGRGPHSICAFKEGLYRPVVYFDTTAQPDAEVRLQTMPGGTIRGVVTDENGRPIADAKIRDHRSGSIFICGVMQATTDKDGRYAMSGYDANSPVWSIGVEAKGYANTSQGSITFPTGQREVEVNFRLGRKSTEVAAKSGPAGVRIRRRIEGRVTDPDDIPVRGALVAYGSSTSWVDYVSGHTDETGHYVLDGVLCDNEPISVQKQGYAPAFGESGTTETTSLDFKLKPQHTLKGKIVDENGDPVSGMSVSTMAEVQYRGRSDHFRYLEERTKSGENGEFTLDSLPAGKVFVDFYDSKHSDVRDVPLEVDRTDHVITVKAPGQISGTVVDAETGKPVPFFTVCITWPQEKKPGDPQTGGFSAAYSSAGVSFNSPDGTFTISELNTGAILRVEVQAPGYTVSAIDRVVCESIRNINPAENVFKVGKGHPLEGIVTGTGATSGPIANARVTLLDTSRQPVYWGYVLNNSMSEYHPITVQTDVQGKFRFDAAPYTKSALVVQKAGFGRRIEPDLGTSRSLVVTLEPSATVRGKIQGRPAVEVNIHDDKQQYDAKCVADKDGYYEFKDVPAGSYRVQWLNGRVYVPIREMVQVSAGEEHVFDSDGQIPSPQPQPTTARRLQDPTTSPK